MANFNKVLLMGNLTRDIEVRHTQAGLAIGKFGLAVNRKFSVQGEQREDTCFVDVTAFGKQAEVLQKFVTKGSPLFVEGRLQFSTWENKEGQKRNKLEVVVENFQFMGRGGEGAGGGGGGASRGRAAGGDSGGGGSASAGGDEAVDYGDIPF